MSCGAGRTCEIQVGHPIQLFIEHLDTIAASYGLEKVRSVSGMLVHPQSEREVGLSSDSIRWSESTGILSFYIWLSEKPHTHTHIHTCSDSFHLPKTNGASVWLSGVTVMMCMTGDDSSAGFLSDQSSVLFICRNRDYLVDKRSVYFPSVHILHESNGIVFIVPE